jgi:hypothetical protein
MASWVLVDDLVSLREEFNDVGPNRSKASDGSIGDTAHSQSSSDHNPDETGATPSEDADSINEVHAIDVTKAGPWLAGLTMAAMVQIIVTRHRSGADDRLQNVIYNRVIWSRSWGWTAREYTGSNPHDKHAHFSSRYTTSEENDTRPWGLLAAIQQKEEEAGVSVQDVRDYIASADKAIREPNGASTTQQNRDDRNALARIVRHGLGLDYSQGEQRTENFPLSQFAEVKANQESVEDKVDILVARGETAAKAKAATPKQ